MCRSIPLGLWRPYSDELPLGPFSFGRRSERDSAAPVTKENVKRAQKNEESTFLWALSTVTSANEAMGPVRMIVANQLWLFIPTSLKNIAKLIENNCCS